MSTGIPSSRPVMTVLEGTVAPEQWGTLVSSYGEAIRQLPPPVLQTFLLQSSADSTCWRISTVWRSRQALEDYRRSVETPGGVLVFRSAGAEPTLAIFAVAATVPDPEVVGIAIPHADVHSEPL